MTLYKNSFMWTLLISTISFCVASILNCYNEAFWSNIFIGLFSGGLLTAVTSFIGYLRERERVMVEFSEETKKMLKRLNEYQLNLSVNEKLDFFLDFSRYDISYWNRAYGEMSFLFSDARNYIFNKIYHPLLDVILAINAHSDNFRIHRNGTGINEPIMKTYISEIELKLFGQEEYVVGKGNQEQIVASNSSKIVNMISKELNGKYYEIMYGKSNTKG